MDSTKKPSVDLARKVLPASLLFAIETLFVNLEDCCLVGGTALAGFYAGHRRSDDIDLFTKDAFSQKAAISEVLSLTQSGATISNQRESRQHFHCLAELKGRAFTIDIVLDPHFHALASMQTKVGNLQIATLEGLLVMKLATLVSRCSEKDLYDLIWLFHNYRKPALAELAGLGQMIDAGVSEESLLISLSSAKLHKSACGFAKAMGVSADEVFERVCDFKQSLLTDYSIYLKDKHEHFELRALYDKLKSQTHN